MFTNDDVSWMVGSVENRRNELVKASLKHCEDLAFREIVESIDQAELKGELKEKCENFNMLAEVKVVIWHKEHYMLVDPQCCVTYSDLYIQSDLLYRLDKFFGQHYFRVLPLRTLTVGGPKKLLNLCFYARGVRPELKRVSRNDTDPISPIPYDDDDRSVHNGDCCCRDCRADAGWVSRL